MDKTQPYDMENTIECFHSKQVRMSFGRGIAREEFHSTTVGHTHLFTTILRMMINELDRDTLHQSSQDESRVHHLMVVVDEKHHL